MNIQTALRAPVARPVDAANEFAADVIAGLANKPKSLPPKYFYDHAGSALFDRITRLPEYYPTRSELGLLQHHSAEMVSLLPPAAALIEFGSGSSRKARILLGVAANIEAYVPIDISGDFLREDAAKLRRDFPHLAIYPVAADLTRITELPAELANMPRAGFFPGSTIGNFEPHEAAAFLRRAGAVLGQGGVLIVGVDLAKAPDILYRAYNDAEGVTAKFNLNLLTRINRELRGNFDLAAFEHHACYNIDKTRIEMHLASTRRQKVRIGDMAVDFRAGDTIHTENSYKYSVESFQALAQGSGWSSVAVWTDGLFSVHALRVAAD
ncbi:MAG TPA: L-histidine N(alpha)-methyltransferase [Xanthobacteraceae bacterium]|nr:L-histidine N(alpha)-methyltransferase [Xanthobacteraceae bacterium]